MACRGPSFLPSLLPFKRFFACARCLVVDLTSQLNRGTQASSDWSRHLRYPSRCDRGSRIPRFEGLLRRHDSTSDAPKYVCPPPLPSDAHQTDLYLDIFFSAGSTATRCHCCLISPSFLPLLSSCDPYLWSPASYPIRMSQHHSFTFFSSSDVEGGERPRAGQRFEGAASGFGYRSHRLPALDTTLRHCPARISKRASSQRQYAIIARGRRSGSEPFVLWVAARARRVKGGLLSPSNFDQPRRTPRDPSIWTLPFLPSSGEPSRTAEIAASSSPPSGQTIVGFGVAKLARPSFNST